jgi:hypothetical protein
VLKSSVTSDAPSTDGTLSLSWLLGDDEVGGLGEGISFELEETTPDGERVLVDAGPHLAAALSGRDDGVYRYRVRAVTDNGTASPWSEPVEVRFEHHPLWLAFSLFAIGAAAFLATAGLVLVGHHRARLAGS